MAATAAAWTLSLSRDFPPAVVLVIRKQDIDGTMAISPLLALPNINGELRMRHGEDARVRGNEY
jgi:hypothetical protein